MSIAITSNRLAQHLERNVKPIVSRNLSHAFTAETEKIRTLVDRIVTLIGSVNHQVARRLAHAPIYDVSGHTISSTLQGKQIRFRSATRQRPKTLSTIVQQITEP